MIKKTSKRKYIKLVVLIFMIFVMIFIIRFQSSFLKLLYPKKYSQYIDKYALECSVDENLIYAVVKAESNFEETAVSNKDAKGLMQIMLPTAQDVAKKVDLQLTEDMLVEPKYNIMLGTKYLSMMIEKYENLGLSLAAYNAGTGTVDKWISEGILQKDGTNIENIPYKETNNYVRKILRDYNIYNKIWSDS